MDDLHATSLIASNQLLSPQFRETNNASKKSTKTQWLQVSPTLANMMIPLVENMQSPIISDSASGNL